MPTREEIVKALRGEQELVCFDPLSGKMRDPSYLTDMNRNSYILYGDAADLIEQQAKEIERLQAQHEPLAHQYEKLVDINDKWCEERDTAVSIAVTLKAELAQVEAEVNLWEQRNKEAVSHASELDLHVDRLQTELDRVRENLMVSTARETTLSERANALLAERDAAVADIEKLMSEVGLQCWEACEFCGMYDDDECIRNAPHKGQCKAKWRGFGDKLHVD